MEEIETKVFSTESIKPSSPTPKSLQTHHLSFLDQLMPPLLSPFVYFYASSNPQIPNSEKSKQLKKSLSEILSTYYPLAGCLVGNLYVDCNDGGAPFSEAEADCDLSQVITNPSPKNLKKFLPFESDERRQNLCMAVQATYFRCGGIAVGVLISHKIADALSFISFVNTWSAVARNGGAPPLPKFDAAAYFPPRDISGFHPTRGIVNEEIVAARIFTFPASKIAALQERYSGGGGVRRPSRVEALSVFIWTQFVNATGMRSDPNKVYNMVHSINLRTRTDPPLSEHHFANLFGLSTANPAAGDGSVELLRKMRETVKAVDGGYVARLKKGANFRKEVMARASKGELVSFSFNSICGFPLYGADFGWGRPVRVGHGGFPYKNLAFFMDTKSGDGIEVLIHLTKQDMEKFEACLKLQMLKSNL